MEKKTPFITIVEYCFLICLGGLLTFLRCQFCSRCFFSLGDLAKRNEITVLKASGINIWNLIALFVF
jgi:hypothetical protein